MRNLPEMSKNYFLNNYIDKTMTLIRNVMFSARRISGQLKKVKNKIFFGYCPINGNAGQNEEICLYAEARAYLFADST